MCVHQVLSGRGKASTHTQRPAHYANGVHMDQAAALTSMALPAPVQGNGNGKGGAGTGFKPADMLKDTAERIVRRHDDSVELPLTAIPTSHAFHCTCSEHVCLPCWLFRLVGLPSSSEQCCNGKHSCRTTNICLGCGKIFLCTNILVICCVLDCMGGYLSTFPTVQTR